ncbi:hypothetical protein MNBD_GAMMA24-788 [hydrothermal vent metagenome]|uniref:Solute-binding protein family 3/N-terminal domain-containing protein n=1 Tax=hydrothermal vent metagenome TaxID=652676 RepID=A0A3B1BKQ0_9ZZZZ
MLRNLSVFLIILALSYSVRLFAKDYRISVARLPLYSESANKGILIDILKAMDKEYKGGKFIIQVYPFQRSVNNVINGQADFHFPTIGSHIWARENDKFEQQLNKQGIRRSSVSLTKTHFALYSNSDKPPLDINKLEQYRIETDSAHTIFFNPKIEGTTCLPCSVRKLSAGRIDGLIFAAREIDGMIKKAHIKNIRRQNYKIFGSKFILPLGPKGDEIDKLLAKLIKRMIEKGTLQRVAKPYSRYFEKNFSAPYLPTLQDIKNQ